MSEECEIDEGLVGAYRPLIDPAAMLATGGLGAFGPDPDKPTVFMSDQAPVGTVQPPGEQASGTAFGGVDGGLSRDEAPYADSSPSAALLDVPLFAQSPALFTAQPPYDQDELMGESFVGRLQPPLGWSAGSYALNTEWDAGSPTDMPDAALPGLRDGAFRFSQRLRSQGDQGIMDNLLRQGGSYLEVNQSPYWDASRPAGR